MTIRMFAMGWDGCIGRDWGGILDMGATRLAFRIGIGNRGLDMDRMGNGKNTPSECILVSNRIIYPAICGGNVPTYK